MKICYVGPLGREGTCFSRYQALCRLGHDVECIDKGECFHPFRVGRLRRAISMLLGRGSLYDRSHELVLRALGDSTFDIVWVDKSDWLQERTVQLLKGRSRLLVQHTTDSMWPVQVKLRLARTLMRKTVALYDLIFTTNDRDLRRLRRFPGMRKTEMGYDDERFTGTAAYNQAGPVTFVGHYEPNTERYLLSAATAGVPLRVNGEGWSSSRLRSQSGVTVGPALWNRDYVSALERSAICLGFLSRWNRNEITVRSFEIPAAGAVLFAPRTNAHLESFREGSEALYFNDKEEFAEKLRVHHEMRNLLPQIAKAGSRRCRTSGYSWHSRMARDIEIVRALLRK